MTNLLNEEKPPRWFVALMAVIITIAVMMALSSCGPSAKLRRAEKLIKQAEAQGAVWHSDTVTVEKKVYIPGDSVRIEIPMWSKVRDTTIYSERVKLRFINRHDTIQVQAECLPDTVKIEVPVTITRTIVAPPVKSWWRTVAIVLACVLGVFIIIKR